MESIVPVDPTVRTAIDRILHERPGIGSKTLKTAYQQADPETMLRVVLEPKK